MLSTLTKVVETSFLVLLMMMLVEWVNIRSRGHWEAWLAGSRLKQYVLSAFLGATPGCLGAYAVAAMYSHRVVAFGALMAAMVATCGDEAFFLLALKPGAAVLLFTVLFGIGILAGWLADRLPASLTNASEATHRLELHEIENQGAAGPPARLLRAALALALCAGLVGVASGRLGDASNPIMKYLLLAVIAAGLGVVLSASGHFIEQHVWRHVLGRHALRLVGWTTGAVLVMEWIGARIEPGSVEGMRAWAALLAAALTGLLPQSGPHLVFVTLTLSGMLPPAVLVANSIVQDGHAMLPMLAESRRVFVLVKALKLALGLAVGGLLLLLPGGA